MTEMPTPEIVEAPPLGVLFDRVPKPGVIVGSVDTDELKSKDHVLEVKLADYQEKAGASLALGYKPGYKSEMGWEYSEYMLLDGNKRPMSTSKSEAGTSTSRIFEYDEKGRLVEEEENIGFVIYRNKKYEYQTDEPDESGNYQYTLKETERSGLR